MIEPFDDFFIFIFFKFKNHQFGGEVLFKLTANNSIQSNMSKYKNKQIPTFAIFSHPIQSNNINRPANSLILTKSYSFELMFGISSSFSTRKRLYGLHLKKGFKCSR